MLAANGRCRQSRLDSVFQLRTLGLYRLRLVLDVRLLLGLGAIPLWPLVPAQSAGMVLGARHGLGAVVGVLAIHG